MILATFAGVMSTIGYILVAILALMVMVIIHELGHYLAGKALGFKILEFTVGFGPKLFSYTNKKNGEIFSIRPFPLGGACMFEDEDENSSSPTAFNNQAPWKRLVVLFAGAFFNFVSAIILITMVFTFYGQPLPKVNNVYEGGGTSVAEFPLKSGDIIKEIDGKKLYLVTGDDLGKSFAKTGDKVKLLILRDGKEQTIEVTKRYYTPLDKDGKPLYDADGNVKQSYGLGADFMFTPTKINFFEAIGRAFIYSFYLVYKILESLIMLITGQLGMEGVGGPITVITTISSGAQAGLGTLSFMICLISANLAVMNLLPLPALDGSRMVFCIIEWIRKKPISKRIEGTIHAVGIILLFGFAIFADLLQLFR